MEKNSYKGLKKAELRKFGYSFSAGMAILTTIGILKNFPVIIPGITATLSLFHIVGALFNPSVLNPTNRIITTIGHFLGFVLTNIFFTVFYYVIFTPFSFIIRLSGKDVIGKKLNTKGWTDIKESDNSRDRITKQY